MAIEIIDKLKPKNNGSFKLMDAKDVAIGDSDIETFLKNFKPSDAGKILETLSILANSTDIDPKYNFEVIEGNRENLPYTEFWILINAKYNRDTKKFERINLDSFSFGWQFQGGGSYPGETSWGDSMNQGINLWRAFGKNAYTTQEDKDSVTKEIGVEIDGVWKEFGYMKGWNNCFMLDSYGGMTIGGAGFEIDGNGTYPYTRVSIGKYMGECEDAQKFSYSGRVWNAFHGLYDADDKNKDSWFYGLECPVDFNGSGKYDKNSDFADINNAKFVVKQIDGSKDLTPSNWVNIMEYGKDGVLKLQQANKYSNLSTLIKVVSVDSSDISVMFPNSTFTRNNTVLLSLETSKDGITYTKTPMTEGDSFSFTDSGLYALIPKGNVSVRIVLAIKKDIKECGISILNPVCGKALMITDDGRLLFDGKEVLLKE
ncbi:MAG: hypothetical protein ACRC1T_04960 [Clostridium chrysemydis]|uniref:hypothetical protein n=1 Tax=Clostridium chrysemydis TaxID=2665504 RepID=UPI003F36B5D7